MHVSPVSRRRSGRALVSVVALAAACEASETPVGSDATPDAAESPDLAEGLDAAPVAPTPWIYPESAPDQAPLSAEDRAAAVKAALEAVLDLDPSEVRVLHDLVYPPPAPGSGDLTGCPVVLTYDFGPTQAFFWQGECTAADGTRYSGTGTVSWSVDAPGEGGSTLTGFDYNLSGRIEAPDGTWIEGAGVASAFVATAQDVRAFGRGLNGTFRAGGPRAPASVWLTGNRRPAARVDGWTYLPTGGHNLVFSGGISGLDGFAGGVTAVSFDGLTLRDVNGGASCGLEPGGSASVRDPGGSWTDVTFDGPTDAAPATPPETCDGCGASWYRGSDIGETCVDTAPLLVWTGDQP